MPYPQESHQELALRDALRNSETLRDINYCLDVLRSGFEPVRAQDGSQVLVPLDKTRVSALGIVLKSQLKLLDKVLPDLKAVEVSDGSQAPQGAGVSARVQNMSNIERATRLIRFLNDAKHQASGKTIEGEHEPEPAHAADPGAGELPGFLST